ITGQITQTAEASRFWEPFNTRPNTIDRQNWKRLKAMARTAINDRVMPALRTWADVFTRVRSASTGSWLNTSIAAAPSAAVAI
ncbi:MAG: hypothetical protein AAF658_20950, partial [Myxococcota bacterium]